MSKKFRKILIIALAFLAALTLLRLIMFATKIIMPEIEKPAPVNVKNDDRVERRDFITNSDFRSNRTDKRSCGYSACLGQSRFGFGKNRRLRFARADSFYD